MYTHPPLHTGSHQQIYFDYWPEVIYQQKVLAKPTNSSISTKVADDLFTLLTSTEWLLVHGGFRWTSHCTSRRRKRGVAQRAIKIWNRALGGAWSPILLWISKSLQLSLMLGNSCWEENSRSRDWREPFNWPFWKNISIVWTLLLHLLATEFVHRGCHRPPAHPTKRVTTNASDPMRVCASVTHLAENARRTVISAHLERPHYVGRLLLCCLLSCGLWYVDGSVRCPAFTLGRCINERLR